MVICLSLFKNCDLLDLLSEGHFFLLTMFEETSFLYVDKNVYGTFYRGKELWFNWMGF